MPLLTAGLLYNEELDLDENMKRFAKIIKINGFTTDEVFVNHAMKRQELHDRAVSILTEAIGEILETTGEDMREINFESFLTGLNNELNKVDVEIYKALGLNEIEEG